MPQDDRNMHSIQISLSAVEENLVKLFMIEYCAVSVASLECHYLVQTVIYCVSKLCEDGCYRPGNAKFALTAKGNRK